MKEQEIFDTVAVHLMGMKERSCTMDRKQCAYRGVFGGKCAAGIIITDKEYDPKMDERGVGGDVQRLAELNLLPKRLLKHINLLKSLQSVHDASINWQNNRFIGHQDLKNTAREHGLSAEIVNKEKL